MTDDGNDEKRKNIEGSISKPQKRNSTRTDS